MKFRVAFLTSLCAVVLVAQTMQMNVAQLVKFLRSELALQQHTDKQIANYLKKVHLTEKLNKKTITDLQAQGAGPHTVEELQRLQAETANLKPPTQDTTYSPATAPDNSVAAATNPTMNLHARAAPIPPPNSVRQQQILDQMRQYALQYTANLPNYICTQVTRRYMDPNGSDHYRILDTWLIRVSYNEGRENYKVYSINNKLVDLTMEQAAKQGGAISTGEFASLMRSVFDPKSDAQFGWDHWGTLRGRRMAVFNYFIDSGHSDYSIDYGGDQRIITAYRGLVYADQNTGTIYRVTFEAVDIPKGFPVQHATDILDFDTVDISGQSYICPLKADMRMRAGLEKSKNDIEFRNYRKFGTESNIQYDMNVPPPLPESKTQEQPATATPGKSSPANTAPAKPAEQKPGAQQPANPGASSGSSPWELPQAPPPPPPQ